MFTGLVEAKGRVVRARRTSAGAALRIEADFARELAPGESVCLNGVCQTVVRADSTGFEVDAVARTLSVTALGGLRQGSTVNLERAVRAGDRLGGHIVTGHVDGVGRVIELAKGPEGVLLRLELPPELARYVVKRGSIAVDGVSLTVADIDRTALTVALIPETLRSTIAGDYRAGTAVNIEADVIAKHQEKLLLERDEPDAGGITMERLRELGFTE
jgi:riboflavin synthase